MARMACSIRTKPRSVLGVWDNRGRSIDRYTVAFRLPGARRGLVQMLGMSGAPSHPQGVSQWTEGRVGRHLGKKLRWGQLPKDIRAHVCARLRDD